MTYDALKILIETSIADATNSGNTEIIKRRNTKNNYKVQINFQESSSKTNVK